MSKKHDDAKKEVIRLLNEVLTAELTAINQYFLHARMLKHWGLLDLGAKVYHESIDEMKHADQLIDRILLLDGHPNLQRLSKLKIGETVREMFECDLTLEVDAIPRLNKAIAYCRDAGDNGSRIVLEHILTSEEEHKDWLESQLGLMDMVGDANYIAQHIHKQG